MQKRARMMQRKKAIAQHIVEQLEQIKIGKPAPKSKVGRPTVITPEVQAKLIVAFQMDFTDDEACLFAHVSKDAYYDAKKRDKAFAEQVLWAKSGLFMQAKANIANIVETGDDDASMSQWLLMTRQRKLYAMRNENVNTNINITPEEEQQIADVLARELGDVSDLEARFTGDNNITMEQSGDTGERMAKDHKTGTTEA